MRPYSSKKFVFAEKYQDYKEQTPEKRHPVVGSRGQSSGSRTNNVPSTQPIRGKIPDGRQTTLQPPPQIPKYKRPVDVLDQANEIVERARRAEKYDEDIKKYEMKQQPVPPRKVDHPAGKPSKTPANIQSPKEPVKYQKKTEVVKKDLDQPVPTVKVATKNQNSIGDQNAPEPPLKPTNFQKAVAPQLSAYRYQELLSKIDYLEEYLSSSTRYFQQLQTKYNGLVKYHKNCTKYIKKLTDQIQEKQTNLARLMQKDDIPYNKKRECVLQAQLQNIRAYNRYLTLRLKAYRASDLTEMALQYNKVNVLNEYEKEQMADPAELMLRLESLAYQMVGNMDKYMANRKKWTFQEEQKYILEMNKTIYDFSMCCLAQGVKLPAHEKREYGQPVEEQVQQEINKAGLLTGQERVIRNTEQNLRICQEIDAVMGDQRELLTYLEPRHLRQLLYECLRGTKRPNQEQIKLLEERVLAKMDRYRRQNDILVATIVSVLARCYMLQQHLNDKVAQLESQLRKISKPLDDLQTLFEYGGEKYDQIYKDKLSLFVRNNIDDLRADVGRTLKEKIPQILLDFGRLRNLL